MPKQHTTGELRYKADILGPDSALRATGVAVGLQPLTGARREEAQLTNSETTHLVLLRPLDSITLDDSCYLVVDGITYIVDWAIDPGVPRSGMWLEVYAHVVGDGKATAGTGVTPAQTFKQYVDTQDAATLAAAENYTDTHTRPYAGIKRIAGDYTILLSDAGKIISIESNDATVTFPDTQTLPDGFAVAVLNATSGDITLQAASGADQFWPAGSPSNEIGEDQGVAFTVDRTNKFWTQNTDTTSLPSSAFVQSQASAAQAAAQQYTDDHAEQVTNKSPNTALGTSDTLYPSQKAVKTYVDNSVSTEASARATADGLLTPKTRTLSTTAPLTGGGDLSADRTLVVSDFAGDAGSGGTRGTVPAPGAGDAAAKKVLKASGVWSAITESEVTNLVSDLAAKEAIANKDAASGYAGLDSGGKLKPAEFPTPFLSLLSYLPNAKVIDAYKAFSSPGAGSFNDVYTVPAGRRAVFCSAVISNGVTGSASTFAIRIKIGATYFRITNLSGTVSPGTGGPAYTTAPPMYVAEAGETFAIEQTTNSAAWFVVGTILEFDNTAALKTSKLAGVVAGDNILYTPTAGKRGMLVASLGMFNTVGAAVYSCLPTGGTASAFSINYLRGAVAPSTSNRISVGTFSLTANTLTNITLLAGLCIADGDSIALGAASATSVNGLVWANVIETPI